MRNFALALIGVRHIYTRQFQPQSAAGRAALSRNGPILDRKISAGMAITHRAPLTHHGLAPAEPLLAYSVIQQPDASPPE
jgi:hypothetical protein